MNLKQVSIWYDPEGDFLEVIWAEEGGGIRRDNGRKGQY